MRVRKIRFLVFFILITACAQIRAMSLPEGIILLKEIDPSGLQAPIWSPDGKRIATAYAIDAKPNLFDLFAIFMGDPAPVPGNDIVIIDTETWESSIVANVGGKDLTATTWAPDSESFAVLSLGGPHETGIYLIDVPSAKTTYLSEYGVLSPDLERFAFYSNSKIMIKDIHSQVITEFEVPFEGYWLVDSWSPDMKKLTLTYAENVKARFTDIYLLELISGAFSQFVYDKAYLNSSPRISPNGQLIAYIKSRFNENNFEYKLLIASLDRHCEWIVPIDDISSFAWSPDSQKMFIVGRKGVYLANLTILPGNEFLQGDDCP